MRAIEEPDAQPSVTHWRPAKIFCNPSYVPNEEQQITPRDLAKLVAALEGDEREAFVAACREQAPNLPKAWQWAFAEHDEVIQDLNARLKALGGLLLRWMNDPEFDDVALVEAIRDPLSVLAPVTSESGDWDDGVVVPPRASAEPDAESARWPKVYEWLQAWQNWAAELLESLGLGLPNGVHGDHQAREKITAVVQLRDAAARSMRLKRPAVPPAVVQDMIKGIEGTPEAAERIAWQEWVHGGDAADLLRVRDALIAQRDAAQTRAEMAGLKHLRSSVTEREQRRAQEHQKVLDGFNGTPKDAERYAWEAWVQDGDAWDLLRVRAALILQRDAAQTRAEMADLKHQRVLTERDALRVNNHRQRRELRSLNRSLAAVRYVLGGRWGQHTEDVSAATAHATVRKLLGERGESWRPSEGCGSREDVMRALKIGNELTLETQTLEEMTTWLCQRLRMARDTLDQARARDIRQRLWLKDCLTALQWCSGATDFQSGGRASIGWERICRPLIEKLQKLGLEGEAP